MAIFKPTLKFPDLVENRIVAQTTLQLDEDHRECAVLVRFADSDEVQRIPIEGRIDVKGVLDARALEYGGACQTTSRWRPEEFGTHKAHFEVVKIRSGTPDPKALSHAEGQALRQSIPRSEGFELTANNFAGLVVLGVMVSSLLAAAYGVYTVATRPSIEPRYEDRFDTPYPNKARMPATGPVALRTPAAQPEPERRKTPISFWSFL